MSASDTLYVSCNPAEGPVARFGVRGVLIGATRSTKDPKTIDYRPSEVVSIDGAEFAKYHQEYTGALDSQSLIRRSKTDYDQWLKEEAAYYDRVASDAKAKREQTAAEANKPTAEFAPAVALEARAQTDSESEQ